MVQQVGNPVSLTASSMLSGGSVGAAQKSAAEMSPAWLAGRGTGYESRAGQRSASARAGGVGRGL